MNLPPRMLRGICVLAFVMAIGTIGFTELHPLSETGRIFTIVLIFGGVGGAAYTLSASRHNAELLPD